jgi:hypothetical protein
MSSLEWPDHVAVMFSPPKDFFLFKRKKFSVGNCNAEENSKFFLNKGNKEPKTVAEIKGSW